MVLMLMLGNFAHFPSGFYCVSAGGFVYEHTLLFNSTEGAAAAAATTMVAAAAAAATLGASLLDDDVRRRQEHRHRRDDGEEREYDEAKAVHHHRGKLPVADHLRLLVRLLHAVRDELELAQNVLEISLRARRRHRGLFDGSRVAHAVRAAQTGRHRCVVPTAGHVAEVIVDVQHVREQTLRRALLQLQLLHPAVHHDRLARDLLARSAHAEEPWQPLQEHCFYLRNEENQLAFDFK